MTEGPSTFIWMVGRLTQSFTLYGSQAKAHRRHDFWRHMSWIGADSIGIVSIIAACTGVILALQSAIQLEKVGALSYVPNLVGTSLILELGPLLTALTLTGKAGAAFTAEIASMQIAEEIDALEVMGIEPVSYLVWPKVLAMLIMSPALTVWADFAGIFAGGVFSSTALGLSGKIYFDQTASFLQLNYLFQGLVKSMSFGLIIALIGCWQGFLAKRGAEDVGTRTTTSVVQSMFFIVLMDLFFTGLTWVFR